MFQFDEKAATKSAEQLAAEKRERDRNEAEKRALALAAAQEAAGQAGGASHT